MYSNRSPPTVPAGIESPYISIPGRCGIAPSTGISRSRRYSSIPMRADAILHRQDNAELRVAAHHSGVGLAGFLDRIGFDHRAHAGQFGEAKRILGVRRRSRPPALKRPAAGNEL